MPQDPNLYGQRPAKKRKRAAALSSSLDFSAQLTSLMSNASDSGPSAGRSRPSKEPKEDVFRAGKSKRKDSEKDANSSRLRIKDVAGTEEESQELARARRKMEDKARLYAAMKRGDYVPKENEAAPLVDFDRKWAELQEDKEEVLESSSGEEDSDTELVDFTDEFGRTRPMSKSEIERVKRRQQRGLLGAEELERMSARPSEPGKLIYGDAVQSLAFQTDDLDKMEELARKRDRSATPPEQKHYDADWEIRTKGTGFYKFSKDEETRKKEMEELEEERKKTEAERLGREGEREKRRREIEERRKEMAERRAKKQADSFLGGLE